MFNAASHHALVAGGVGVTAFLALAEDFKGANWDYVLHLAVKSKDEVPFRDRLAQLGERVKIYDKAGGNRMDLQAIVNFQSRLVRSSASPKLP